MIKKLLSNQKIKNDIILAVSIILLAATGLLLMNITGEKGEIVCVKIDGKETARYLITDTVDTVIYTGEGDNQINRLVIKNGEVYVSEANCPDKICVNHKKIENANETIICLPHKVVVEILSADKSSDIDMAV